MFEVITTKGSLLDDEGQEKTFRSRPEAEIYRKLEGVEGEVRQTAIDSGFLVKM